MIRIEKNKIIFPPCYLSTFQSTDNCKVRISYVYFEMSNQLEINSIFVNYW